MAERDLKDIQPIIDEVKHRLKNIYGDKIKEILLYGSYAKGEATEGSDIDMVVVLENVDDVIEEREKIIDQIFELDLKYDVVISVLPLDDDYYRTRKSPLLMSIDRDGIKV